MNPFTIHDTDDSRIMTLSFPRFFLILLLSIGLLLPARFCTAQDNDTSYITTDTTTEYHPEDYIPSTEDENDEEEDEESSAEILPFIRTISADSMAAIRQSPDFAYMSYLDSLLRARQREKDNRPEPEEVEEGPSLWDLGIVKLICWAVAIGLVGFVLYKLFLGGGGVFFTNRKQELPMVELEDTPNESNLESALQQAIKKEDYRMATRYLFLITLSRLGEKGALQLSTEKTNYQYATELSGKPYAAKFAKLSLQYEYVWFGGFAISQPQFATLQQQHQQFLKAI